MTILLASKSQRRQELLRQFGYPFRIYAVDVPEISQGLPSEIASQNALAKAQAVAKLFPESLVIGADTIVVYDRQILGKPATAEAAYKMLRTLSDREHQVVTGVALLVGASQSRNFTVSTKVKFRQIADYEIASYIQTGEPFDKAGAYGIQGIGGAFVESILGCYYNVVGLPMPRLILELRAFGFDIFAQGTNKEEPCELFCDD